MFSYVGLSLLILLHFVVIAVLIPETSESIHYNYSEPIDIVYRSNEIISAQIRLEDPLKCMDRAEYKYMSTNDIVQSKKLDVKIAHMDVGLQLFNSYNNSKAYIAFYTADNITLGRHILFSFHLSNSGEKHECLEHCLIIFNITEVFKHSCKDNYSPYYKKACCESNENSLLPIQPALDSETLLTAEREHGAKTSSNITVKEQVKIDILPNVTELYYTPGIKYTFACVASSLLHNQKLQLVLEYPTGNRITNLPSSEKTVLQYSFRIREHNNNSRIYCHIDESIKSNEITLFARGGFQTSTERLEASSAVFHNSLSDEQSTDSTELSTSHGQKEKEDSLKLLWYIGPILGVLCFSVGVLYFYFKRKKNNASRDTDIYTYTTQQQLMYAQLQLDSSPSHPVPRKNEGIFYTTIVGVLKPKQ